MRAALLLTGSAIWGLTRLSALINPERSTITMVALAVALVMIAVGLTHFWDDPDKNRFMQPAICCLAAGLMVMGYLHFVDHSPGYHQSLEIIYEPTFVIADALLVLGSQAFSYALWKQHYPKWIALGFGATTLWALCVNYVAPDLVFLQPGVSLLIAFFLAEIALFGTLRSTSMPITG